MPLALGSVARLVCGPHAHRADSGRGVNSELALVSPPDRRERCQGRQVERRPSPDLLRRQRIRTYPLECGLAAACQVFQYIAALLAASSDDGEDVLHESASRLAV